MITTRILALALAASALSACGTQPQGTSATKEAWDSANAPIRMDAQYEYRLNALPTSASLAVTPWSDTYWPSNRGGIAARWAQPGSDAWTYRVPSFQEARSMSLQQLAQLSPAEKYSLYTGDLSYSLVMSERQRTHRTDGGWFGLCHGWAPAAINYREPKPVTVTSAQGLQIPFGSADVKALLDYWQGQVATGGTRFLGSRCNIDLSTNPGAAMNPECRDTNAGSFHVVLTNELGRYKRGFVADVTRDLEVWNQPVHGFSSQFLGTFAPSAGAAFGTVQEVRVRTAMKYTVETQAIWNATNGTSQHADQTKVYQYRLELNAAGQIIGGAWETEDRPDFLWGQSPAAFSGRFQALGQLYSASIQ
jgi:hypothetical protein